MARYRRRIGLSKGKAKAVAFSVAGFLYCMDTTKERKSYLLPYFVSLCGVILRNPANLGSIEAAVLRSRLPVRLLRCGDADFFGGVTAGCKRKNPAIISIMTKTIFRISRTSCARNRRFARFRGGIGLPAISNIVVMTCSLVRS